MRPSLVIAAVTLLATTAFAQAVPTPPKDTSPLHDVIDMTQVLPGMGGQPIPDGASIMGPNTNLTLGIAIAQGLCTDRPTGEDRSENALAKAKRCDFGKALMLDKAAQLTGPQITEIEDHITAWPGLIVQDIISRIDPNQHLTVHPVVASTNSTSTPAAVGQSPTK